MARTADAIATDPVLFYRLDGVLEEIPISEIYFDEGVVKTDRPTGPNDALLPKWLEFLAARGDLKPAPKKLATALRVNAKRAGSATNHITVEIKEATNTDLVNITVKQIDTYKDLTLADLNARLGTSAAAGTEDGLIRVKTNDAGAPDPVVRDPVTPTAGPPPTWTIASAAGPPAKEVTLELKNAAGLGTATVALSVLDVRPAGGGALFNVRVECKIEFQNIAFGGNALPAALQAANYLVDFLPPDPAPATFPLPRPATITLSGGADKVDATAAKGTLAAKT